jgi:hypothetical protein
LILLGREIDDLAVCCDFKDLRGVRLRAVFALLAAASGAAFGENFARDGEALETFLHLVGLVGEPERRGSPEMELTLRQLGGGSPCFLAGHRAAEQPGRRRWKPAWAKTCHSLARAKIAIGSRFRAPEGGLRYIAAAEARNIEPAPNVDSATV